MLKDAVPGERAVRPPRQESPGRFQERCDSRFVAEPAKRLGGNALVVKTSRAEHFNQLGCCFAVAPHAYAMGGDLPNGFVRIRQFRADCGACFWSLNPHERPEGIAAHLRVAIPERVPKNRSRLRAALRQFFDRATAYDGPSIAETFGD